MNKFILALGLVLAVNASAVTGMGALIDPSLVPFAVGTEGQGTAKVMVLLAPVQNNLAKPERYNRPAVVSYFKEMTRQMSLPLLADIQNGKLSGVRVNGVYWINGSVIAEVNQEGLKGLSMHPAVTKIYVYGNTSADPVLKEQENIVTENAPDYNMVSLGLDRLFKEKPNLTGQGSVVGVVDTGVDGAHPALSSKVVAFWNGQTGSMTPAKDFDSHGTHVSGTIAGGDRSTNFIGVAPSAKLAVAGALQGYDQMLAGMQWFIDIDKNPQVGQKIKAVNCSWNTEGAKDQEAFYRALAAWEAAGILPVFSAGNSGPKPQSITKPHEYPGTFAVAAYGANGKIADFSSRGPAIYKGQQTQKPDLAAPGVAIKSSVPGAKYANYNGTSMATPHVTGTAALLLQVNPAFNPVQLKQIMLKTLVTPAGQTAGKWSADWGFGQLNTYAAVMAAGNFMKSMGLDQVLSKFITTPSQLDDKALAEATMGEVGVGADLWESTDATEWVSASQLYN